MKTVRFTRSVALTVAALSAVAAAAPARAGTVTERFTFAATGIADASGVAGTAPYATVGGSFTLTFDPTSAVSTDATTGLTVSSLTPAVLGDSGVAYRYDPTVDGGELIVGGLSNGVEYLQAGTDDFGVVIGNVLSASPTFGDLAYTTDATSAFYTTDAGTLTVAAVATPLPTSATAGLSLIGLLGVARLHRRRRPLGA